MYRKIENTSYIFEIENLKKKWMKRYIFILCCWILFSCNKDVNYVYVPTPPPPSLDSTSTPYNPLQKRIKSSIKIHDDNVNGVYFRKVNKIQEAVYYFYNEDDLLDGLIVYSDTSRRKVNKSAEFEYIPAENKVKGQFYDTQLGHLEMDIHYNGKKQVLKISYELPEYEIGVFFDYKDDTLTEYRIIYHTYSIGYNMEYDENGNLMKYLVKYPSKGDYQVEFKYDNSVQVDPTFDIRFASIDTKFLYEGGVNILHLMGLNTGIGNTHIVIERNETNIPAHTVRNQYKFEYRTDNLSRIIERKATFNQQAEAVYQFNY